MVRFGPHGLKGLSHVCVALLFPYPSVGVGDVSLCLTGVMYLTINIEQLLHNILRETKVGTEQV